MPTSQLTLKTMSIEAIILAGGLGTRIKELLPDKPKVLAQVNDRPFLFWLLEMLATTSIKHVVLSVGHLAEQIKQEFGSSFADIAISYSRETIPAGTGGALKLASKLISNQHFMAFNGDSLSDLPVDQFYQTAINSPFPCAIGLAHVSDTSRYGRIELDNSGKIVRFSEKKQNGPGYINAGVYCFSKSLWTNMQQAEPFSLEETVLPNLLVSGILGVPHQGMFIDIGTPDSYSKASSFIDEWVRLQKGDTR